MTILLPHQLAAARKMHNGCILKGATGTGKTITALTYYSDNDPVERLIVVTTAKKRDAGDWEAEGRLLGIFPEVTSWQLLKAYRGVQGAFFIFDEQRLVGSGAWVKYFLEITKHNQWVMLTATPGDTWLDYIPVFLANGFYRTRSEFLREHVVFNAFVRYPKVERYLGTQKLERLLGQILVEMPFGKHTTRHEIDVYCEHDREAYNVAWRSRWNAEKERPIRNGAELCSILRKIINGDASRLRNLERILLEHPRIIVFYNFDYELEILRGLAWDPEMISHRQEQEETGSSSGLITGIAEGLGRTSTIQKFLESFAVAEWNGHKHEPIPETESWVYLVQYSAGSEAWNCTATDTVVYYSLTYSYRMFEQSKGRIDRLDTEFNDLYYYIFKSATKLDAKIYETLLRKQNFNERKFMKEAI